MRSFKQFLLEETNPPKITTAEELLKLPNWHQYEDLCYVDPNSGELLIGGQFASDGTFVMSHHVHTIQQQFFREINGKYYFPMKFSVWTGDLNFDNVKIENLSGIQEVTGNLDLRQCNLGSMEGFPTKLNWLLIGKHFPGANRLDKYITKCKAIYFEADSPYVGFLSLLKINSLKELHHSWGNNNKQLVEAIRITNKHLKKGRNVLNCQEELIDNNLEEYAVL